MSRTRLLGTEHKKTFVSAANLAFALVRQGKMAEAAQILSDTLALCQRTLGPSADTRIHAEHLQAELG